MNSDDRNECLKQLSINLQIKISKIIIVIGVIFYCIYLLAQFTIIFKNLSSFHKSEFTYLNSIGNRLNLEKERSHINFLNFLDSSSKLMEIANPVNISNSVCNASQYLCSYSNATEFSQFDALIKYLKANSQMLKDSNMISLLLLSGDNLAMLNPVIFDLATNQSALYAQIYQIANSNSLEVNSTPNNYVFKQFQIEITTFLTFLCANMMPMSIPLNSTKAMTICIVYMTPLVSTIGQNYYFLQNSQINSNATKYAKDQFISIINSYLINFIGNPVQDIDNCLNSYPSAYGKYLDTSSGLLIGCKHNQGYLLNLFGPGFFFVSFVETINFAVATTRYKSIFPSGFLTNTLFISSNSTFYSRCTQMKANIFANLRQTGYLLLLTLTLLIALIHFSNHINNDVLLYSVDIITTLCEFLKNKEEKQFNRHLSRGYPEILSFIVEYFHQFLWIHKLRKFKGKYKYKKLLLEGLQLFDEENYVPVLKFIYSELITIKSALVQKLFKIKELPHKKRQIGSKCEEERIEKTFVHQEKVSKRRNANFNLLDPDDDQLMKNISVSFRGNRGVRFSNDIQTIEIDEGPVLRKTKEAKYADGQVMSCETIKNDLSQFQNESLKRSDFNKESIKSLRSEEESYTSLIDISRGPKKKDSSTKTRSLQSIHVDLDNLKLDEEVDDDELLLDQQSEEDEVYNMTREQITIMIAETYEKVMGYYQRLIDLLAKQIEFKNADEIPQLVNLLYILTIRKYEKYYELLLYESQNEIEKQFRQPIDFQDFKNLERNYNHELSNELTQQAEVLRECIFQAQNLPISFQNLQDMYCKSSIKKIRIAARHLLALAAEDLQPHLDLVLARNVYANLKEEKTTSSVKQESLAIFMRNLQRYTNFWQELQQLKMAAQFYNTKNKKFYFLVSIASIKIFTPVLSKFYELLDNFDIFNIYNLEEDTTEISADNQTSELLMSKTRRKCMSDKIKYLMDLQGFIELFNFSSEKVKENQDQRQNSVKTINKKRIYEKQFHEILMAIENDEVEYSKYIVIFLGDEHNISSGDTEQSSSSANHRPFQQKIHLDITKVIEKGYLHFILVGYQLESYPSKYGRLKKYVKLSPELFEVELSTKQQQENLKRLEKYLQ